MKKYFLLCILIVVSVIAKSQVDSTTNNSANTINRPLANEAPSKQWSKLDLSTRANDHFMVQYGLDMWPNVPDSINTSGFSRRFNAYIMLDKPFQSSPHFSIGIGVGIGSSNIFFSNTYINLKANTSSLQFSNVTLANHFDKYKLTTTFAEVPLELRYSGNPVQPDKGFKLAIGVKGGFLLSAHTKGKNLIDSSSTSIYDSKYIQKEYDKKFINSTRFAITGRIGYGHLSLDGSYQVTGFLKTGAGPIIRPVSIGLTLSGL